MGFFSVKFFLIYTHLIISIKPKKKELCFFIIVPRVIIDDDVLILTSHVLRDPPTNSVP